MKYKNYAYCYDNFTSIEWLNEAAAFELKMAGDNSVVNMTKKHGIKKSDCMKLKVLASIENGQLFRPGSVTETDWIIMWELIKE